MNKHLLVVTTVATLSVIGLYTLPRVVVSNKGKQIETSTRGNQSNENTQPSASSHQAPIPEEKQKSINISRGKLLSTTNVAEKKKSIENLMVLYAEVSRFDSAAYFAEQLSIITPSEKNFLRTADAYYGAFQFAMDDIKSQSLGEKTRLFYQKALDINPNLLEAKTNMAMTYVSSSNPMQGILLLREVLEESPNFEPALFNMGILSMKSNQFAKAEGRFRQIIEKNPKNTQAQFYLGVSLVELGKKEEAKTILEKVAKTEKDPAIQAAVKETLEKL
jgi:tetratricopeptide (TPR) repeat protein